MCLLHAPFPNLESLLRDACPHARPSVWSGLKGEFGQRSWWGDIQHSQRGPVLTIRTSAGTWHLPAGGCAACIQLGVQMEPGVHPQGWHCEVS